MRVLSERQLAITIGTLRVLADDGTALDHPYLRNPGCAVRDEGPARGGTSGRGSRAGVAEDSTVRGREMRADASY
jgi:hypothetical protein